MHLEGFVYKLFVLFFIFISSVLWAEPSLDLTRIQSEGRQIRDSLHTLLLKTKNPGTLGISGPSSQELKRELETLEAQLLSWKETLTAVVNGSLAVEQKAQIIAFYFAQYSILVQVRALAGPEYSDEAWPQNTKKSFSFPVSVQVLYEISGDSPLNLASSPESPVILDEEPETFQHLTSSSVLHLQLSGLHVSALRQMALSNEATAENYFTLVQFLMVSWFFESLDKTHLYMTGKKKEVREEMPAQLSQRFQGFGDIAKNLKLKKWMMQEKICREQILQHIPEVSLFFADDAWVDQFTSALLAPEFHDEYVQKYKQIFNESEPVDVKEALAFIVRSYPLPLSPLSLEQRSALLKKWYTQARASVIQALLPDGQADGQTLSQETKLAIAKLFMERFQTYSEALPPQVIADWAKTSFWEDAAQEMIRSQYVFMLIELSKKIQTQLALPQNQLPLDLVALDLALEKDFLVMGLEPATLQRKMAVVQQPTVKEAKDTYEALLTELKVSIQKNPKPSQVQTLSQRTQLKVCEKLEKELKEFLKVGEWYLGSKENPSTLGDLPLTDVQKEAYREMMKVKMMGEHHILMMEVGIKKTPLYEQLGKLNPAESNVWIQEALEKIQDETIEKIHTVAQAKTIDDIQTIVAKSPLLHALISQYPAFGEQDEDLKRKVTSPSFANLSWNELHHRITYPGFTFLLLHWVIKFVPGVRTHPLMRVVDAAISPYLSYFLVTAFSMVGVNIVWQWETIEEKEDDIALLKEYLETSAGDDSFSDLVTVTRAQEERDVMWSQWKSERVFDVAFLGFPFYARPFQRFAVGIKDRMYGKLFQDVGFSQGKFSWNEMDIRTMSKATLERIRQDHANDKNLQGWMTDRVQTAEQKLLKIIQRSEKSMQRKTRHFQEEFGALRMEEGQWDPVAVIQSLERMKVLRQEKLISQEVLDEAIHGAQELLKEVRVPFQTLNPKGPAADLQRRLIFVRDITSAQVGEKAAGVRIWIDDASQYMGEEAPPLDPVLERNVQTVVDAQGHEFELIMYKRVSPYVARKVWPWQR